MAPVEEAVVADKENSQDNKSSILKKAPTASDTSFADSLKIYYEKLFPANLFYKWLTYGRDPAEGYFVNREFSFTLEGDVYLRYLSFKDNAAFKKDLTRLNPIKIDLGAVYDHINDKQSRKPREREFVLDIDMTDFDDTRSCCSEADICPKCWPFMSIAIRVLHTALTEDFGFKHILWVYSGRRGIHCWVGDRLSRELSSSGRTAVVNYLDVLTESNPKRPKIISKMHPSIERASNILRSYIDDMAIKQGWVHNDAWWEKILNMCTDTELRGELKNRIFSEDDGENRWTIFKEMADKRMSKKHMFYFEEVLFHLLYPRLDVNVSTGINHLLKAPFCLHPKTGRVCVPIDPAQVDKFDPFNVPTGSSLISELEVSAKANQNNIADFQRTSIKPYVDHFSTFIKKLLERAPKRPEYEGLDF